jgi:MFS-type transporter involved in bile tolerance (Atg22 family)
MLTPFTNSQFGWHELEVSILFAVAGIEIALVYILLHFITKKFSDQSTLLFGYCILSIACLIAVVVLPFSKPGTQDNISFFLLFVALDIFALPLVVVTSTSLFTRQISDDQQGMGQGIQRFVVNIATVVGPLFAGALLPSTWSIVCTMFVIVAFATFSLTIVYRSFRVRSTDESSSLIPPINYNDD